MKPLLIQTFKWFFLTVIIVACGWFGWTRLRDAREPRRPWARRLLEQRLGEISDAQRQIADQALDQDPLMAILAAHEGHDAIGSLEKFVKEGPSPALRACRAVLQAGLRRELDGAAAEKIVNEVVETQEILNSTVASSTQPSDSTGNLVAVLEGLPISELQNVAYDSSYLLIVPRIPEEYRDVFRSHQDILTPLLTVVAQEDWTDLLAKFNRALPRGAEIFRDSRLGPVYGWIYVLHRDLVDALVKNEVPEQEALDFVGLNASAMRELNSNAAVQIATALWEEREVGIGQKTLFTWACLDPAIFWIMAHAESVAPGQGLDHAMTVVRRYAGTIVPALLSHYAVIDPAGSRPAEQDDRCFSAVLEAVARFEVDGSPVASILSEFQNDSSFKRSLAENGPRLVPAISCGGREVLDAIQKNPRDLDKYVTPDGKPAGKPWWTWVPGGSIAFVIREKVDGRSVDAQDWIWAGTDLLVFYEMAKGGKVILRLAQQGAKNVMRKQGERIVVTELAEGGLPVIRRAATQIVAESEQSAGKLVFGRSMTQAIKEALLTAASAGLKVSKVALRFAGSHPVLTGGALCSIPVLTAGVLCAIFPDQAEAILRAIAERAGRAALTLPAIAVKAIYQEAQRQAVEVPMVAPLFYLLATALTLLIILSPLVILRLLLPEVFNVLCGWLAAVLRAPVIAYKRLVRRTIPATHSNAASGETGSIVTEPEAKSHGPR